LVLDVGSTSAEGVEELSRNIRREKVKLPAQSGLPGCAYYQGCNSITH